MANKNFETRVMDLYRKVIAHGPCRSLYVERHRGDISSVHYGDVIKTSKAEVRKFLNKLERKLKEDDISSFSEIKFSEKLIFDDFNKKIYSVYLW